MVTGLPVLREEEDGGEKEPEREYFGWVDRIWEERKHEGGSI
jgi:hypothetical protein